MKAIDIIIPAVLELECYTAQEKDIIIRDLHKLDHENKLLDIDYAIFSPSLALETAFCWMDDKWLNLYEHLQNNEN